MSAEPSKRKKPSSPATPSASQNVSPSAIPPSPVRPRPGQPSPDSPTSHLRPGMASPGSPTRPPPPLPSHLLPRSSGVASSAATTTVRPLHHGHPSSASPLAPSQPYRPSPPAMGPPRPSRPSPSAMGPPRPARHSPPPMGSQRPPQPSPSRHRTASSSSLARPQLVLYEQLPFCFGTANRCKRYPAPHPARPHPRPSPPHPLPPPSQATVLSSLQSARPPSSSSREQLPVLFRPTKKPQVEGSSMRRSRRQALRAMQETPAALPTLPLKSPSTSPAKPLPSSPSPRTAPSTTPLVTPGAVPTDQGTEVPIEPLERYLDDRGNEFIYTETISSGAQGTTVKAVAKGKDGAEETVCLKLMRVEKRLSWERERDAYRVAWRPDPDHPSGQHPGTKFLLKFYGSFEYGGQLVLVLELAKEDLIHYVNIRRWSQIPRREIHDLIRDICRGLDCLHSKGVVHRDIKPDNILLSESRGVLLADLGVACRTACCMIIGDSWALHPYMAPEITRDKTCRYRMSVDMYSVGVLVHSLVCRKTPKRSDTSKVLINAIEGWDEAKDLVDGLLQEVPEQRWTIQKVLGHNFFHEVQENVNAKGDRLELEEGGVTKEEGDGGIQVKEEEPVPVADEHKKESAVIALQGDEGEGEREVEGSDVKKKTEVEE
ncbi:MAG: kinase-like domain-containing protein [Linnemannia elongata]|nr:MAG: kinase-like domain-containing protein [Linnemannia elongata]